MNKQDKIRINNLERFVCDQKKAQETFPEAEASEACNNCKGYEVFCSGYRNIYVTMKKEYQ